MPFKWESGKNPYRYNYFGRLGVGPNVQPREVIAIAKKRCQSLAAGRMLKYTDEHLDEHAVHEASKYLRKPMSLAEELLLVHPQTRHDEKRLEKLTEQVRQLAVLPEDSRSLPLYHPLAIFWFLPAPGIEAAEMPGWYDFGFVEPGDPEDLELDIVFDA